MKGATVNQKAIGLGILSLVICFIVGSIILEMSGHDSAYLIGFALTMIPLLIVQLYQGKKTTEQNEDIQRSVNGKLTAQFVKMTDDIKSHVDDKVGSAK